MEKSFILNLQKLPDFFFTIMNGFSLPFHLNFFFIIIIVLYYKNIINATQIFILLSSQLLIGCIKTIAKRKRPFIQHKEIKNKELMKLDYYSFPSGHTFNAFLIYYFLNDNNVISGNSYIAIVPYLVGLSRVSLGVHYPTDVIFGAILAKLVFIFYKYYLF